MNSCKLFILSFLFVLLFTFIAFGEELEIIKINGKECVKGELLVKFKRPVGKIDNNQILNARSDLIQSHKA